MSMEREAEVLGLPTHGEKSPSQAKSVAQGRGVVERYVERLETGAQRLHSEPEASELFCALAELRQGLIETDLPQAEQLYLQALSAFKLCHVANAGLRRLQRGRGDFEGVIAILLRDLTTASANRRQALQLELARTWLYCACDPERAIAVLETLREEGENGGEDAFDAERFFLWEDALLASGAWDRYEALLRKAMAQQTNAGPLTQRLAARLWMLYRYVLPDESQAEVLRKHLLAMQASDDELILETLAQAEKAGNRDGVVDILCQAMERDAGSPLEVFYRLHMADVAHYEYEDLEHAVEVIREGLERHPFDLSLLRRKISLQAERGDKEGLLEALTQSLEAMHTPKLKAEQLHMIACILRDDMDQEESAMDVFLEANRICPTYGPTNVALSEIYLREENYSDLAQMLEYELSYAIEHQDAHYTAEVLIDKHARLAWIYEEKLCFGLKAFHHYQAILKHRAPDIAALKGASRMAQGIGNWTELLKLYAAAEGCTQDTQEHIYLLERIAHIADVYLNDADTACTALEALRSIEPRHAGAVPALSRLYVKLKKWDSLIALTDEEVDWVTNPEYKASLLCRNGEISEQALSNMPQAILYYEKARTLWPGSRQAYGALGRLYRQQKAHEKLVDLWKAQAGVTQDPAQKCEYLHRVARILITNLDAEEEALEVYESCLKHCPGDAIARKMLLEAYEKEGRWQDVLRILKLELKAGGSYGQVWLTHEWMGRIQQYLIGDASAALASYAEAFSANPANIALLRTWLALSLRLGTEDQTIDRLKAALEVVNDDTARYEIAMALADLTMKATHDPADIAPLIKPYAKKALKQATRFLRAFLPAVCARDGEWIEAMTMAFADEAVEEEKCHALLAAMILDMPQVLRKRAHAVLCSLKDDAMAADLWAALPPYQRPDHKALKKTVLSGTSHDAQDLRRWCAISRLLAGDVSDPTERLLPESRDTAISYRVDLELLAAYFERFEKWLKLLEVLSVQKENTLNEQEQIQVTLQRAWVLSKIKKPDEALASAREACRACSYGNPMRSALYDYLSHEKDWDFLLEQIRQHLMNEEDKAQAAILWMRLANIYGTGMSNPEESLRCLDQAYHANPSKGSILVEISEVAHRLGEIDIARRALDDYIHYHDPSLNEQLGLAPKLLDLHFNVAGGDAPRMIAYFETLVQKTAQSRDCLITLAKAHAKAGDPHIAAETLLRIVAYPFVEEDLSLWLILADLYQNRLGEATKGEELLWKLFATYPKAEEVFERLDRLYIEPAERRIFVENLKHYVKTSQPIATDPILVRKLLSFAARILSTELGLWSEAQELYSAAIEVSSDPAEELVKNRAYARCRVPGETKSAYLEFCQLLVHDPFQTDIYRAALDICRRNDAHDRARILRQLASVFVPEANLHLENESVRPKLMDARPLGETILQTHFVHKDLRPIQPILHEAMPILSECFKDALPKRTHLGGGRVRSQLINDLFATVGTAFGRSSIKGFYGHDTSPVPTVFNGDCWISADTWETMKQDSQRHWAGYAAGLLWTGIERMVFFEPNAVWRILDGIYYTIHGRGISGTDAYTVEAAENVGKGFLRGTHREVSRLIDEVGAENLHQSAAGKWADLLYATADRAGLLFSGSLTASIPELLVADGWNPDKANPSYLAARFAKSRRIPELIAFALSEDYLILRHQAGLAMRPSQIQG